MSTTLQADDKGALHLPPSLLPTAEPLAIYRIQASDGQVVISKAGRSEGGDEPFWKSASTEEWLESFSAWMGSHTDGPNLPDEATSRDSM
jgi:hypothetical protein